MELTDNELIIGLLIIGFLVYRFVLTHKDRDGRIKDQSVRVKNVLEILDSFEYQFDDSIKAGYSEKSIQKQLKVFLQKNYVHVTDEYGIEGINATKIDFDIGNGKVGLEIKLAKEVFKTSNLHRLIGQMEGYCNYKYRNNNLIVAVFGEAIHSEERSQLKRLKEKIETKDVHFKFIEISI